MLTRCCEALAQEPGKELLTGSKKDKDAATPVLGVMGKPSCDTFANDAWRFPWVHFNCFLAIAALDDARLWGQFLAYASRSARFRAARTTDLVPLADNDARRDPLCQCISFLKRSLWHWPKVAAGFPPDNCSGYAYWLFAQDGNVYDFTGR
jgi:hypothetical protein